jgi:hypothetical protein
MPDPPVAAALAHLIVSGNGRVLCRGVVRDLALETVPPRIIAQQQCSCKRDPAGRGGTPSPLSFRQDAASPTYVDLLLTTHFDSRMSLK